LKKFIPPVILLLASAAIIWLFYGQAILSADNILFSDEGDAIKNYFSYAWHIAHDSSCVNFQGMNYPYGEHLIYADGHPALSNSLRMLSARFEFFNTHSIGVLNLIMVFSIFLTFITCYFLLREFDISTWISLLFSFGMALLAPQIFRMTGHFALSYSVAIPLAWLLAIKALKSPGNAIFGILLFLSCLLWMFIHAYLGIIVISFLSLLIIFEMIPVSGKKFHPGYLLLLAAVVLPVIIFYLSLILTDVHTGRTVNPSGFFFYNAEIDDVFIPHQGLFRELLDRLTGNIINQEWEARSYVGFSTTIILLASLIALITRHIVPKRTGRFVIYTTDRYLKLSLLSAFILLLFAMAFPFKQIPGMIEAFPVLKQFRATGRFTWPFFFTAMVFSAIFLQNLHKNLKVKNKKYISIFLILVVAALNIAEAIPYHSTTSKAIIKSPNHFRKDLLPDNYISALNAIKPDDFQAIVSLPFYYFGSESFSRPRNSEAVRTSMIISYHTGIPLVNAYLTRTSIAESKNIVQLISPDYYTKEIIADLPCLKPLLLVKSSADLTINEQDLLKKGALFYKDHELGLYSLSLGDLTRNSGRDIIDLFQQQRHTLTRRGKFYATDSSSLIFFTSYDDRPSAIRLEGEGAFSSIKRGENILAEFSPETFAEGKEYHLSVWMHNGVPDALNLWFRLIIGEYDERVGKWHSTVYFPEEAETIDGDWSLAEGVFQVRDARHKIRIITKGSQAEKAPFHADNLLIRESGTDVYRFDEPSQTLFYNNHRIRDGSGTPSL